MLYWRRKTINEEIRKLLPKSYRYRAATGKSLEKTITREETKYTAAGLIGGAALDLYIGQELAQEVQYLVDVFWKGTALGLFAAGMGLFGAGIGSRLAASRGIQNIEKTLQKVGDIFG